MKKNLLLPLLAGILCILMAAAPQSLAEQSSVGDTISCREQKKACEVLQMIMAGQFDEWDPQDSLTVRVFAAACQSLCEVGEADFTHYLEEFGGDEAAVREKYFRTLSHCICAGFLMETAGSKKEEAARKVLLLFMDSSGEESVENEKTQIREQMTEETASSLSDLTGAPLDWVLWLLSEESSSR